MNKPHIYLANDASDIFKNFTEIYPEMTKEVKTYEEHGKYDGNSLKMYGIVITLRSGLKILFDLMSYFEGEYELHDNEYDQFRALLIPASVEIEVKK